MTNRQEWLLLFLGADGGTYPVDQVRVMKGMFLLDQAIDHPATGLYHFDPYDYGPFDSAVYRDLDALELKELIRVIRPTGSNRRMYDLTESGRRVYEVLTAHTEAGALNAVQAVKTRVTSLGFEALLKQIYDEFPEYAMNSRARLLSASA